MDAGDVREMGPLTMNTPLYALRSPTKDVATFENFVEKFSASFVNVDELFMAVACEPNDIIDDFESYEIAKGDFVV